MALTRQQIEDIRDAKCYSPAAWERVYHDHAGALARALRQCKGASEVESEDAVHEGFIWAWSPPNRPSQGLNNLCQLGQEEAFFVWMFRICVSMLKWSARPQRRETTLAELAGDSGDRMGP